MKDDNEPRSMTQTEIAISPRQSHRQTERQRKCVLLGRKIKLFIKWWGDGRKTTNPLICAHFAARECAILIDLIVDQVDTEGTSLFFFQAVGVQLAQLSLSLEVLA